MQIYYWFGSNYRDKPYFQPGSILKTNTCQTNYLKVWTHIFLILGIYYLSLPKLCFKCKAKIKTTIATLSGFARISNKKQKKNAGKMFKFTVFNIARFVLPTLNINIKLAQPMLSKLYRPIQGQYLTHLMDFNTTLNNMLKSYPVNWPSLVWCMWPVAIS